MRVSYRGREDGWILTSNKRGPTLAPAEDPTASAEKFDAQEAEFAQAAAAAEASKHAPTSEDRPLTGAKRGAALNVGGDRPLTGGGGKGAWVPPSEFPPGHEEDVPATAEPEAGAAKAAVDHEAGEATARGSGDVPDTGEERYMIALG